jgi:hypothetical protein
MADIVRGISSAVGNDEVIARSANKPSDPANGGPQQPKRVPVAKLPPLTAPFALRRPYAAAHASVSTVHFDKLVEAEIFPRPRILLGVKVWIRPELEEAMLSAPHYGERDDSNPCDRLLK